ncbi:hypothetical protein MLD38_024032 [Melastoma candidum]|uniref:Uncharacterized protein n=1 Tax=Melastoma candidum TaxID=119954 RepID=A0ACB9NSC8_9MYRT|nr:hypothetical protein MLD38_024032 [Melastoma candidum]
MMLHCHLVPVPLPTISDRLRLGSSSDVRFSHFCGKPVVGIRRGRRRGRAVIRAAKTDHYKTLRVGKDASLQEIKSSYRKLARQYHPDMNKGPGAEEKFKEISAAYEVLSDEEKRSLYDQFGEAGLQGEYDGSRGGPPGVDPFEVFSSFFSGSDDFFGDMGEQGGFNFNLRGAGKQTLDVRHDLFISFEESIFGGQKEIEVSSMDACGQCSGTGAKSSSCIKMCSTCGGRGGVVNTQKTPFGMMSQVSTCSKCSGSGKIITESCQKCGGSGKVKSKRAIKVVIPRGVNDGLKMRVQGEGNFDKTSGLTGDLWIILHVNARQGIWREGINLYSKIDIDFTDAILGTVVKVDTVEGLKELNIPAGIQPGDTLKLRTMGVPDVSNPSIRGDHRFIVNVLIPKDTSDAERKLVEELALLRDIRKSHNTTAGNYGGPNDSLIKEADEERVKSTSNGSKVGSFWRGVKGFLRRGQPREKFASISGELRASFWFAKPDPSSAILLSIVCVVTSYFTIFDKSRRRGWMAPIGQDISWKK